jgi:hypothetical protein
MFSRQLFAKSVFALVALTGGRPNSRVTRGPFGMAPGQSCREPLGPCYGVTPRNG